MRIGSLSPGPRAWRPRAPSSDHSQSAAISVAMSAINAVKSAIRASDGRRFM